MKRKFLQNKLWRDKLVSMMEDDYDSIIHWQRLDDQKFDEQLRIKLVEETQEVCNAKSRDELMGEIADVYEVLDSLMQLHNIEKQDVSAIQLSKKFERGGFEGRMFVEVAEHPIGSFGEKYCLADPKKYPEII